MLKATDLKTELKLLGSPEKASGSASFFKTGKGQYGEGDIFIGVTNPELRKLVKVYKNLPLSEVSKLLLSPVHEERAVALFILVDQYKRGDESHQKAIYDFYMAHLASVNNWDLVDGSAEFIVGPWLEGRDKKILQTLAHSNSVWERRVAMLSTFYYIKQGDPTEAFIIIEILINDLHDLIQKAVGWMLREIGKRCSEDILRNFLKSHYKTIPRTSLRYAIERFDQSERQSYLKGLV